MRSDRIPIIAGEKHAMLTILKELPPRITKWGDSRMVLCKCECGNVIEILLRSVKTEQSKSCGCLTSIRAKECKPSVVHGLGRHPLNGVWQNIKNRCYNKNVPSYQSYGNVGVKMCEEWRNDFMSFYNWAIENGLEEGLEVDKDKIPIKLGIPAVLYSPEMCSILTMEENMRYRTNSVTQQKAKQIYDIYKKGGYFVKDVANMFGVSKATAQKIINGKHWTVCSQ